jgi:Uma2 family endonuclease
LGYPPWQPDLAVEVLAHDDHPADTLEKVAQWLKAGVRVVWLLDCERRNCRVYRADGTESQLDANGTLDGEDLLPGFRCPLADLW